MKNCSKEYMEETYWPLNVRTEEHKEGISRRTNLKQYNTVQTCYCVQNSNQFSLEIILCRDVDYKVQL